MVKLEEARKLKFQRCRSREIRLPVCRNCLLQNLEIVLGKKSDVLHTEAFSFRVVNEVYLVSSPFFLPPPGRAACQPSSRVPAGISRAGTKTHCARPPIGV